MSIRVNLRLVFLVECPRCQGARARDLQDLSHGRLKLGLGTQVKASMEGRFSVEWKPRCTGLI